MFVVLQHPFADLRSFSSDECNRVGRPTWPLANPGIDFVRSSGSVRARKQGGVAEWAGEELFCDASMALRFPDRMAKVRRGPSALPAECRFSFRRFYSQGIAARIEIGLRLSVELVPPVGAPSLWLEALFAWLSIEVAVGSRGYRAAPLRLIDAGPALAAHYLRASTKRPKPALPLHPLVAPWWFQSGIPSLIVESTKAESIALPPHSREVAIPPTLGTLQHAWLQIGTRPVSAWFLESRSVDAPALRHLRIHLLRLHAEREALRALLTVVMQRRLDITKDPNLSDSVQQYLNDAIRAVNRPARHGIVQIGMIEVARAAFDDIFPGETATLESMRHQVGSKVDAFLKRSRTQARTINEYHYHGEYMNTTITLGNVSVSGDFNLVTAKKIENSFNKAASATDAALGDALKALSMQVAELVKQLPPETKEAAARDLETLTDEATSKAPRKAWYELSAQGLIDAAKTVAAMAGPIATAVKTVMGLLI